MKKISRRSFLAAATACGAAAALTACGGSSASSTAASSTAGSTAASAAAGPVTLQWSVWDKESTPYWQAMADGYMASHKDVTIEMVDLGSSDYMTVLATQLAGSADLDIVTIKDIPGTDLTFFCWIFCCRTRAAFTLCSICARTGTKSRRFL